MTTMTAEERTAYREAKREQAEKALAEILTEQGWSTWLRLRRNLRHYSLTNQMLIAIQAHEQATAADAGCFASDGWVGGAPDTPCDATPTLIKPAGVWKRDGYHPAKGSRGLLIWVFKSRRRKDGSFFCCGHPRKKSPCEDCGREDHYFQLGPVFDASQVRSFETGERPETNPPETAPVTGETPGADLLAPLAAWALDTGLVGSIDLAADSDHGEGGSWNPSTRELRVCSAEESANARLRVLIHELAHAKGISSHNAKLELTYAEAEVAVETVSYIVASTAGLDTAAEAIPYIAGWGGEGATDKVRALAALIDETARQLEEPILALLNPEEATA